MILEGKIYWLSAFEHGFAAMENGSASSGTSIQDGSLHILMTGAIWEGRVRNINL